MQFSNWKSREWKWNGWLEAVFLQVESKEQDHMGHKFEQLWCILNNHGKQLYTRPIYTADRKYPDGSTDNQKRTIWNKARVLYSGWCFALATYPRMVRSLSGKYNDWCSLCMPGHSKLWSLEQASHRKFCDALCITTLLKVFSMAVHIKASKLWKHWEKWVS